MCQGLTIITNRVSMGVTPIRIRTRIKAKGGVITKATIVMDGGTI